MFSRCLYAALIVGCLFEGARGLNTLTSKKALSKELSNPAHYWLQCPNGYHSACVLVVAWQNISAGPGVRAQLQLHGRFLSGGRL